MLAVLLEEVDAGLDELACASLNLIIRGERALDGNAPLPHWELVVPLVLSDVILLMLDVSPALEHEGAESLLAQLLGGPSATDAGADDDRVVLFALLKKHACARDDGRWARWAQVGIPGVYGMSR